MQSYRWHEKKSDAVIKDSFISFILLQGSLKRRPCAAQQKMKPLVIFKVSLFKGLTDCLVQQTFGAVGHHECHSSALNVKRDVLSNWITGNYFC